MIPLTLMIGLDDATLVVANSDGFDIEGRVILPVVRLYLPAE